MKNITIQLDSIDKALLHLVQQDASLGVAQMAERVGLTTTPCWRRIQRLQSAGVIRKSVTLLAPEKLNLQLTVFVHIKALRHDSEWLKQFANHTSAFDEVVEFYRLSGEYDYLLKVLVADMAGFDHFYKRFIAGTQLQDVTSSFAMENIKNSTELPLNHL
ncbi:Lrp/AsnC family transcriptional regulator [Alteromonas oceanisediminis]|uniref:Lrp/AsnC family transcriptional regulator n=1 Tax=Alteromonas oceanisediminis TaxID=2836180 RepID=UPI001BD9CA19|nr:Lrp/AsnC family transcriptional regulator [Alteromonas oceanisediminis]MBT0587093.1 Lrp/AsnC family transcriptional regulator [Alteromonas oceanisediminis]